MGTPEQPMSFLFDDSYYAVHPKSGVSPFQNMCAYLGGSAIQTFGDNPVTAYRQLVQQYAKDAQGNTVAPKMASAEAQAVFKANPVGASLSGLVPRMIGVLLKPVSSFSSNFFVILFKSSKILTSFGELTLFHTFTNVPVNECTFCVHKIEFVIHTGGYFTNSGGVGNHRYSALYLCKISSWNYGWWLVVNTYLEAGWAPVYELDCALGLYSCDSSVYVLWYNITAIHHAACHVFSVARIALNHHVGWLKHRVGDVGNRHLLVVCLLCSDNWSKGAQWERDTWVWYKIGLELGKIDVQLTFEAKGSSDGGDALRDQAVKVGVGWAL